jgi:hypothetical protein
LQPSFESLSYLWPLRFFETSEKIRLAGAVFLFHVPAFLKSGFLEIWDEMPL